MDDSSHVYTVNVIEDNDAWDSIARFKERAGKLIDLQDDLSQENPSNEWSESEQNEQNRASDIPGSGALKSFYDAFRYCYARQERSNFRHIHNIMSNVTIGEHEQAYVNSIGFQWTAAESRMLQASLIGRDLSGKEIMDLRFEETCDDADTEEQQRIDTLKDFLCEETSQIFLFQIVLTAVESIRLLYDVVKPLGPEHPFINVPDYFISYV